MNWTAQAQSWRPSQRITYLWGSAGRQWRWNGLSTQSCKILRSIAPKNMSKSFCESIIVVRNGCSLITIQLFT